MNSQNPFHLPPNPSFYRYLAAPIAASFGFLATGCSFLPSHLHNESNAAMAADARDRMKKYAENAPAMYGAMAMNVEAFRAEEDRILGEYATVHDSALVSGLTDLTKGEFVKKARDTQTQITVFEKDINENAAQIASDNETAIRDAKTAAEKVKAMKSAVDEARARVASWNASIALLQAGIADLPTTLKNAGKAKDLKSLGKLGSELSGKEIAFADADGKIVKRKAGSIAADLVKELGISSSDNKTIAGKPLPDAPGIDLTVLNLGLDLAEIERKRAELQLEHLHARAILFEDALAEISAAKALLADSMQKFELPQGITFPILPAPVAPGDPDPDLPPGTELNLDPVVTPTPGNPPSSRGSDRRIAVILDDNFFKSQPDQLIRGTKEDKERNPGIKLVTKGQNLDALHHSNSVNLVKLRQLTVARSILARNQSLFKVRLARVKHLQSIAKSSLGDEAHQALIRRSLEGIAAYHNGGFTKEDAAKIIQLAQAAALGSIARNTR